MNRIIARLITGFVLSSFAFAQTNSKQVHREEQTFKKLERQLFDAFEGKTNLETLERLYANDFFTINADGKAAGKKQTLEALRAVQFQVDKITSNDFRMRRYGNTVIITGRSAYFKYNQKLGEVLHTQIWTKRKNRWQMIGWQGTPIK